MVRPFPNGLMNQVFDRDRINSIEVVRKRKGGSMISVLYRFAADRPNLKNSAHIETFLNDRQAEAVAAAIQSELLPQNFDVEQIEQHERFSQAFVLRFIAVPFFIVFELFVCSSIYSGWNQMGFIERLASVFMAFLPIILWYRIRRTLWYEQAWHSELPSKKPDLP